MYCRGIGVRHIFTGYEVKRGVVEIGESILGAVLPSSLILAVAAAIDSSHLACQMRSRRFLNRNASKIQSKNHISTKVSSR